MKTIGLLGGLSWESTALYYAGINRAVNKASGGQNAGRIIISSVNLQEILDLRDNQSTEAMIQELMTQLLNLELAGAELLAICSNTPHQHADRYAAALSKPLLHIASAVGEELSRKRIKTAGLLGTKTTMEDGFYQDYLSSHFGIRTIVPEQADRDIIHEIIFGELTRGITSESAGIKFFRISEKLVAGGAEGIILGCTELGLVLNPDNCDFPVVDSARAHIAAIVENALSEQENKDAR